MLENLGDVGDGDYNQVENDDFTGQGNDQANDEDAPEAWGEDDLDLGDENDDAWGEDDLARRRERRRR